MAMSQGYGASARIGGARSTAGALRPGLTLLLVLCMAGAFIGLGLRGLDTGALDSISRTTAAILFQDQDLPWFVLCLAIVAYIGWAMGRPLPPVIDRWVDRNIPDTIRPTRHLLTIALAVMVLAAAGSILVYRDAQPFAADRLAALQADIFRQGALSAPIPEEWAGFGEGLYPSLSASQPDGAFIQAAGGPVFAAVRAMFELAALGPVTNALLAALSVVLIAGIARRLWPDHIEVPILAAGLLATSPQFLFTGMDGSAWSAQLCLNLLWLRLFLRDDRLGHVSAALVGLIAAGLQHIPMHTVFVLPFLVMLLRDRRWLLASFYALAYGLGHFAWLHWHEIAVAATLGAGLDPALAATLGSDTERPPMFALPTGSAATEVGLNLLRLLGWTNLIVAPLVFVAIRPWSRLPSPFRMLAIGIVIAALSSLVLVPGRHDGWGYALLHGHLGSLILLAVFGWVQLATGKPHLRAELNRAVGLCCVVMLLIAMPLRAVQVDRVTSAASASIRHIQQIDRDVVVVDLAGIWFGQELVRNDPFLQQRPKIVGMQMLTADELRALCNAYTVAVVDHYDLAAFGVRPTGVGPAVRHEVSAPDRALRSIATGPRCSGG